ncbi:glycosyl transferase family 1 [Pseudomonas putida KG-4]|nr:glycosyl transferase family 1 [Pseudomonas putida KG-4]HDS0977181.1 glycosyltransferase family 4 protein [Pseudomonas putida]
MATVSMIVWNDFLNDARVLKEAQTLQSAGHEVTVFALHKHGVTSRTQVLSDRIKIIRIPRSPFSWPNSSPTSTRGAGPIDRLGIVARMSRIAARLWTHAMLCWRMARRGADVVHAHDVNVLPTAWLAARLSGAKLIYDAHEISTGREGYASFRTLVAIIERALMPRAQGTITTTDARAKFFARAYGVARPIVLQNRPRLQPEQVSTRIRDELQLEQPWPIVLYQGGLQQGRGLERLVRAAALVPNTYFVLIGGGRLDASLRSIAAELGLGERVRFIPTVGLAELPSYTASADIGVQPIENTCLNHFTTDSNKLFEYVQAGLPVVVSDLPEIRRVVRKHDLGLLVPPGETEALAAALRSLVEDESRRKLHAGHSRAAAAVLNWEAQEDDLLVLYKRVLGPMVG